MKKRIGRHKALFEKESRKGKKENLPNMAISKRFSKLKTKVLKNQLMCVKIIKNITFHELNPEHALHEKNLLNEKLLKTVNQKLFRKKIF